MKAAEGGLQQSNADIDVLVVDDSATGDT